MQNDNQTKKTPEISVGMILDANGTRHFGFFSKVVTPFPRSSWIFVFHLLFCIFCTKSGPFGVYRSGDPEGYPEHCLWAQLSHNASNFSPREPGKKVGNGKLNRQEIAKFKSKLYFSSVAQNEIMHPILVLYFAFKEEGKNVESRRKSYQW